MNAPLPGSRPAAYSAQAPEAVVMVRPHRFTVNTETAADNRFQLADGGGDLAAAAYAEITRAAATLGGAWRNRPPVRGRRRRHPRFRLPQQLVLHACGRARRALPDEGTEPQARARQDILEVLKSRYRVQDVIDYSGLEADGLFLEGTGAMVLDHVGRVAYAARSDRTDPIALERFATHFNFEPMAFDARDEDGAPIYHTNVLMCVATGFAMIGLDMIADRRRRAEIAGRLERSGRQVVALTSRQIRAFAGNAMELQARGGRILALSTTALAALEREQIETIAATATPVPLDIPTIEKAGGSVRCTLAGIHLTPRA